MPDARTTSMAIAADPIETLVRDVVDATGIDLPPLMTDAAATFASHDAPADFYLVGLIGGKDVGKSSLANAIAGVTLAEPTNTGEGTRRAIAYVYRAIEPAVRRLLEAAVPNRFEIVTHEQVALRSQVLVDLPDIDSKYQDHIDLTRSMLRHLLFPVFVQSIEKYADQRPQELLRQVAQGNDPANFIFCLTKIDQLVDREGADAPIALAADYATRLKRILRLDGAPRVHCVSAFRPDAFDLPALRRTLSRDRDPQTIERSLALARGRRALTLVQWLDEQQLGARLERSDRTLEETRTLVEDKLLAPTLARVLPRLTDDASLRGAIAEQATRRRLARWPIVNVIDAILGPLISVARRGGFGSTRSSVAQIVGELTPPLDASIRAVFAEARRRDAQVAQLYGDAPPWGERESESRVHALVGELADAVEARQKRGVDAIGRGHGATLAPMRWLLTVGAAVWFPIVQPILEVMLAPNWTWVGLTRETVWRIVHLLSGTALLQSVTFLAVYFVALWATLRFTTLRRVERLAAKQLEDDGADDAPAGLANAWAESLLAPLATRSAALRALVERLDSIRSATRAA